ncbi:MAG: HPP family protein [Candidatus Desulforudis sp.]|nr:HPP family protein [Desulforudis sp.]
MENNETKFRILDPKFKNNAGRYLLQCALAAATILVVLVFLDVIAHTAIIATLGASAFIVFTMPKSYPSQPRPLLGGYFVGILVGCVCCFVSRTSPLMPLIITQRASYIVFGALAVGIAILLMTITNTEHPPAAGMALGLVLNDWDYLTIIFILGAITFMFSVRQFLKSRLIDLM